MNGRRPGSPGLAAALSETRRWRRAGVVVSALLAARVAAALPPPPDPGAPTAAARDGLRITASSAPLAPPPDHASVLVHHARDDPGGNTSLRFVESRQVDENKYPPRGVTVFAQAAREQPQRDRDLGQTFVCDRRARLDALFLRIGHAELAVLSNAPGARVAVQWFEVTGPPRLDDRGTPGFAGKFDRLTAPELDDVLEGEAYAPLRVVEGRLPDALRPGDYLKLDFTGDDEFTLEPQRTYAFLLMFLDRAPQRGMTLANEYYGTYIPDPALPLRGHGIRREGGPAFPDDWRARLSQPPGTAGFPDVCTFRDLHFAVTVKPAGRNEPPASVERRDLEGWSVFIRRELLDHAADSTARALELLREQLAEIARVVPRTAVAELRQVPLHLAPAYPGRGPTAEFHPDAGWLRDHGRDPALAAAVEFSNVPEFAAEADRMPSFVLHELAHAYHHRVLPGGFAHPELQAAFARARAGGRYDRVERWHGRGKARTFERAYAMTDAMEYFAETTESFFGRNDFFPYTREELRAHDPDMFALLARLWGAPAEAEPNAAALAIPGRVGSANPAPVPRTGATDQPIQLAYAPAPPDNPLKGFVPYLRADPTFPHSLEWDYTKLSEVMSGPTNFNWAPFEAKLAAAASRGHQFFARFYLEWPGRSTGVPQYLIDAGLTMRRWTNTNTQPWPPAIDHTPDYEDPRLRAALTNFIHAFGRRYDGDPRLGFVGLGLLGTWGEWHNWPNDQWFASKTVQREILDAYEAAFQKTRLVARYPAGPNDPRYAANHTRALGYHDDSFAWATVHTGKPGDAWFFETRLRAAGALDKWRTQPIGGEVRPEVWPCLFDEPGCAPKGQEFDRCVAATHASWLCNEGVFRGQVQGTARERALRAAQRLGYELHVTGVELAVTGGELVVSLTVTNTGVAPFYYDWPVELGALEGTGGLAATWRTDWKLTGILPGEPAAVWRFQAGTRALPAGTYHLLLRVPNPLPNGPPLRFANQTQDRHLPGWLTLGEFSR